jgi:hypothetical protein
METRLAHNDRNSCEFRYRGSNPNPTSQKPQPATRSGIRKNSVRHPANEPPPMETRLARKHRNSCEFRYRGSNPNPTSPKPQPATRSGIRKNSVHRPANKPSPMETLFARNDRNSCEFRYRESNPNPTSPKPQPATRSGIRKNSVRHPANEPPPMETRLARRDRNSCEFRYRGSNPNPTSQKPQPATRSGIRKNSDRHPANKPSPMETQLARRDRNSCEFRYSGSNPNPTSPKPQPATRSGIRKNSVRHPANKTLPMETQLAR